jgi:hypothetical protein
MPQSRQEVVRLGRKHEVNNGTKSDERAAILGCSRGASGATCPKQGEGLMRWFLQVAGSALLLTGVSKAFSAIGTARVLDAADPLIGIRFRELLLLVGLAELLIAFFCLFTDKQRFSLLAVAWISTNFLVYRLGLWFIGWHHPCACMGRLAGVLHLSDQAADNIMKGVLAFLLTGSCLLLIAQRRQARPNGGEAAKCAAEAA